MQIDRIRVRGPATLSCGIEFKSRRKCNAGCQYHIGNVYIFVRAHPKTAADLLKRQHFCWIISTIFFRLVTNTQRFHMQINKHFYHHQIRVFSLDFDAIPLIHVLFCRYAQKNVQKIKQRRKEPFVKGKDRFNCRWFEKKKYFVDSIHKLKWVKSYERVFFIAIFCWLSWLMKRFLLFYSQRRGVVIYDW